jgi:hypothetical protein
VRHRFELAERQAARGTERAVTQRYRVESRSHPGAYYALDVVGGDVTCDCPGFG